jgi:nucleoside-diphosphate-sugar epimerase
MSGKILVTGASGFIASHCILDLLANGYEVRGSIRDLARADSLKAMYARHGGDTSRLAFAQASLTEATGWQAAAEGCTGIFHVASPVPTIQPKNPEEVVGPAKAGTMHVLEAAKANGIERLVVTSSVAAIFGGISENRVYTADDWSDPDDPYMTPYSISKTIAEQAAWDFCREHRIALTTVNPALVLGPALEADYGSSLEALVKLMKREIPLLPRFGFEIVDVRDVASLHRLAFEQDAAIGQRLIAANGFKWFREIADILQAEFPDYRIPRKEMPNWLAKCASLFIKEIASFINDLDVVKSLDNSPAMQIGWQPRSPEEAIVSGGRSLVEQGVV